MLFRSEEHLQAWLETKQRPRGESLTLAQTWALARAWYGSRMDPAFRGRTVEEAHQIFRQVGFHSEFWY